MSISSQELFYEGYDHKWILGRDKGPPVEAKAKKEQEAKKEQPPKGPQAPAPVELKVPLCCEGCEKKMKDAFLNVDGMESVKVDSNSNKVTITGKVKPEECLKVAKKVAKRSEMWPKKKEEEKKGGGGGGGDGKGGDGGAKKGGGGGGDDKKK